MHVLTTRINNKDLGSHPVKRRIGMVEFFSRGREGEKRRREDGGRDRARKFNSMVDFATSLPDYCRYTLPWMKGLFHPTRTTVLSIVSLLLNFFQSRIDYIESGI